MIKLPFSVVAFPTPTPSDPEFPPSELNRHTPQSRGWQSPKFTTFPISLTLRLDSPSDISQLQILSHQSKIATKIEVIVGLGQPSSNTFESCPSSKRLGYISLDSNVRSDHQARELKSVHVAATAVTFVRLTFHGCWTNNKNKEMQVGVVAVNVLGSQQQPISSSISSSGGSLLSNNMSSSSNNSSPPPQQPTSVPSLLSHPPLSKRYTSLQKLKTHLASIEEFDRAAIVHSHLGNVVSLSRAYDGLSLEMARAAEQEDYKGAANAKRRRDGLKAAVEEAIMRAEEEGGVGNAGRVEQKDDGGYGRDPHDDRKVGGRGPRDRDHLQHDGTNRSAESQYNMEGAPSSGIASERQPYDSPVRAIRPGATVQSTPNGTMSRDVFRSGGGGSGKALMGGGGGVQHSPSHGDHNRGASEYRNDDDERDGYGSDTGAIPNGSHYRFDDAEGDGLHNMQQPIATARGGKEPPPQETFLPGQHPLEGVPLLTEASTVYDLPTPELLTNGQDRQEVDRLSKVIGEYRVRCFLSSNWQLRDAVLCKTSMILQDLAEGKPDNASPDSTVASFEEAAPALCAMIARAVDDRVTKVFLTSLIVLDDCLHEMEKIQMTPKTCIPLLEKIILTLLGKLADRTKPSVVEGAFNMLFNFALSSCVGHVHIGMHALRPIHNKAARAPKTIVSRLELLSKLVVEFGEDSVQGDKVMEFIASESVAGFTNKDSGVRQKAKELTCHIYKHIGSGIMQFLTPWLNPRTLREYRMEFDKITCVDGVAPCDRLEEGDEERFKAKSGLPKDFGEPHKESPVKVARESPRGAVGGKGGSDREKDKDKEDGEDAEGAPPSDANAAAGRGRGRGRGKAGVVGAPGASPADKGPGGNAEKKAAPARSNSPRAQERKGASPPTKKVDAKATAKAGGKAAAKKEKPAKKTAAKKGDEDEEDEEDEDEEEEDDDEVDEEVDEEEEENYVDDAEEEGDD